MAKVDLLERVDAHLERRRNKDGFAVIFLLSECYDQIKRLRGDVERLLALCNGKERVLELNGYKPIDFDEMCARVSAHEYQALDLEILTGFAQGAFDCLERERESNRALREKLEKYRILVADPMSTICSSKVLVGRFREIEAAICKGKKR